MSFSGVTYLPRPRHCAVLNCRAGAQKQTPLQVLCSSPQADSMILLIAGAWIVSRLLLSSCGRFSEQHGGILLDDVGKRQEDRRFCINQLPLEDVWRK